MSRQHPQPYKRPEQEGGEEISKDEPVEVHIRANFWAVGFVIGGLQFFRMLAGWGYEVEFTSPSGQRKRDIFRPKDVRRVA
ncbi:uncharacterized protein BJ212DRAFT_1477605 [Suillus subaureus]|uniref:Uncharacterized protein n=1 Tax=Suillus subaureus TaxID=48587 RepID=A0A9P7EHT9_9AGAM|nr:uncharacterized protein BJ212DRAFT_1477605 [Suillus subaureus]KAG1821759.1 hypothetical protein BJ212DRAFT_1477605 [Suillus subaureus]